MRGIRLLMGVGTAALMAATLGGCPEDAAVIPDAAAPDATDATDTDTTQVADAADAAEVADSDSDAVDGADIPPGQSPCITLCAGFIEIAADCNDGPDNIGECEEICLQLDALGCQTAVKAATDCGIGKTIICDKGTPLPKGCGAELGGMFDCLSTGGPGINNPQCKAICASKADSGCPESPTAAECEAKCDVETPEACASEATDVLTCLVDDYWACTVDGPGPVAACVDAFDALKTCAAMANP